MRIIAVGVATLDILNTVAAYPREDDEVRVVHQRFRRGGNATNTLVVLSQLGHACSWAGTIAAEHDSRLILKDLSRYKIDTSCSRQHTNGKVPTSYVLLSEATGSRTIVHYRDLPEYQCRDFIKINTQLYDWIHFEGRNISETREMLRHLKQSDPQRPVSLEVEKPREGIERLYPYPDILLFSQAFALAQGHDHPADLFASVRSANKEAVLFCAWGERGAWLQTADGEVQHEPAAAREVVDTLAAGDVFNAGVIHGMLQNLPPQVILQTAVQLAGDKCAQYGLDGLVSR